MKTLKVLSSLFVMALFAISLAGSGEDTNSSPANSSSSQLNIVEEKEPPLPPLLNVGKKSVYNVKFKHENDGYPYYQKFKLTLYEDGTGTAEFTYLNPVTECEEEYTRNADWELCHWHSSYHNKVTDFDYINVDFHFDMKGRFCILEDGTIDYQGDYDMRNDKSEFVKDVDGYITKL